MRNTIPFGLDMLTGKMLDSRQVRKGLACGCVCPECKAPLEAVHGDKRKWHFRHAKSSTNKTVCIHPLESSIHMAAKELFMPNTVFKLPKVAIQPGNQVPKIVFAEAEDFHIVRAESEYRRDGNDAIPDIALFSGNRKIYVEILVTHAVGDDKIEKLHKRGVPTLEIDLGKDIELETMTQDDLKTLIFGSDDNKTWVYTEELYQLRKKLAQADYLRVVEYITSSLVRVRNCPLSPDSMGTSTEECGSCKFCISIEKDGDNASRNTGTVICSARAGFSLKDAALTAEEITSFIEAAKEARAEKIKYNKEMEARRDAERRKRIEEEQEIARKRAHISDLFPVPDHDEIKNMPVIPRPQSVFKCVKCGKEGPKKEYFRAMKSSEEEPICDECVISRNYAFSETAKIFYCPKCGVMLYGTGTSKRCGSFVCQWTNWLDW